MLQIKTDTASGAFIDFESDSDGVLVMYAPRGTDFGDPTAYAWVRLSGVTADAFSKAAKAAAAGRMPLDLSDDGITFLKTVFRDGGTDNRNDRPVGPSGRAPLNPTTML